jgi:hypothetical protein
MSKREPGNPQPSMFGFADQIQNADGALFRSWWDRTCLLANVSPAAPKLLLDAPAEPALDEIPYRLAS